MDAHDYMRKVKVESEKMKWPLIMDRSSHKTKQRFVSTWPQIWSKSVEISVNCSAPAAIASLFATPPHAHQTIFTLLFTTRIGIRIGVVLTVFGLLNNESNVLNNEFELERGALLLNETNTNGATGVAIGTTFILTNSGVGLGLKNKFDSVVRGAGPTIATVTAAATTTTNENINNEFYAGAPATHTINTNSVKVPAPDGTFYFVRMSLENGNTEGDSLLSENTLFDIKRDGLVNC